MACKNKWLQWCKDLQEYTRLAADAVDGAPRCVKCNRPLMKNGQCVLGHAQDAQPGVFVYPEELAAVLCAVDEFRQGGQLPLDGEQSQLINYMQAMQGLVANRSGQALPSGYGAAADTVAAQVGHVLALLDKVDEAGPWNDDPRIQAARVFAAYRDAEQEAQQRWGLALPAGWQDLAAMAGHQGPGHAVGCVVFEDSGILSIECSCGEVVQAFDRAGALQLGAHTPIDQARLQTQAEAHEVLVVSLLVDESEADELADQATDVTSALGYVAHLGAHSRPVTAEEMGLAAELADLDQEGVDLCVVDVEILVRKGMAEPLLDEATDLTSSLSYVGHLGASSRPATVGDVLAAEGALGEELGRPGESMSALQQAEWLWREVLCPFEESDLYGDYEVDDELWQQAMDDVRAYMAGQEPPTLRDSMRYLLHEVLGSLQDCEPFWETYGIDGGQWDDTLRTWREYVGEEEGEDSWTAGSRWQMLRDRWGHQAEEAETRAIAAEQSGDTNKAQRVRRAASEARLLGACADMLRQSADYTEMDADVPATAIEDTLRAAADRAKAAGLKRTFAPLRAAQEALRQADEYAEMGRNVPTFGVGEPFAPLQDAVSAVRAAVQAELAAGTGVGRS